MYNPALLGAIAKRRVIWTPSNLTNPIAWFVSDNPSNTYIGEDILTRLQDKGSFGLHAKAEGLLTTSLNTASMSTDSFNGRRLWSSTPDLHAAFTLPTNNLSGNVPSVTAIVLMKMKTPTAVSDNPVVHMSRGGSSNSRFTLGRGVSSAGDASLGTRRTEEDGYREIHSNTNHGSGMTILCGTADYVNGVGTLRLNGSVVANGSFSWDSGFGNTASTNSAVSSLGHYDGGAGWFDYAAGEVVIVKGVLTSDEIQRLEGYIAWGWGAQDSDILPVGHPYKTAIPFV